MQFEAENRRLLIVDDNQAIHDDIRSILAVQDQDAELDSLAASVLDAETAKLSESRQYEIDSALQGRTGPDLVRAANSEGRPYALAFVDMRMPPGWDGLKTIQAIREIDQQIQIVICTAYSDYSWQRILSELGASDWLLILKKPFDVVEVQQLACSLTEKWSLGLRVSDRTEHLEDRIRLRSQQLEEANDKLQYQVESLAQANTRLAREIAGRHMADQQIRHLAFHDALTDLPNRLLLTERIEGCINRSKGVAGHKFAVLYCDLDNFKLINDSLGHRIGDQFLVQISRRLTNALQSNGGDVRAGYDTVARIGGDEFVVLLDDIPDAEHACAVSTKIREAMSNPISVENIQLTLGVSMGIAVSNGEYDDPTEILRDADTALYHAKDNGKSRGAVFDQAMRARVTERLAIEFELRRAIQAEEFEVYYQPIVSLQDSRLTKAEALVRWNHPTRGILPPSVFIPIAEETGMIGDLGAIILDEAVRQTDQWRRTVPALSELCVSVNLSPWQLNYGKLEQLISEVLGRHRLPAEALALEITESASMDNLEVVKGIMTNLQQMGVSVHLDDFGTGYSSLSILHTLPFDTIKLDRSFIIDLGEGPESPTIIQAIVMLAQGGDFEVVAEGIETYEQLSVIRELGCDFGQGYYFSRPLPAKEFEAFCAESLSENAVFSQAVGESPQGV